MSQLELKPISLEDGSDAASRRELRRTVCSDVTRACKERYGRRLRSIVLTGSLARDEASFVQTGERWELAGDAEFLLVFHRWADLPEDTSMVAGAIEGSLGRAGIQARIELDAAHSSFFRNLRPGIFAYELLMCGCVIHGDTHVLGEIPAFNPDAIPLEDAWRMLANRVTEHVDASSELDEWRKILTPRAEYSTVKLYLDMATSLLLFAGEYAPTYAERQRRLEALAAGPDRGWPFPLTPFVRMTGVLTDWKLQPGEMRPGLEWPDWEQAIQYARELWQWELGRLTGTPAEGSGSPGLMRRWMSRQPVIARLRGWLIVLRKLGYRRARRHHPRWARPAWRGSPRYFLYQAASELCFRLPRLLSPPDPREGGEAAKKHDPYARTWRDRALELGWYYKEFVVGTRS